MKKHILVWTQAAIDCYQKYCECEQCLLYYLYFKDSPNRCQMKDTVKELLQKVGHPKKNDKKIRKT